ncbi:MAG: low molecular weight phosphotyrosine protein phosphatase [Bacilli bacterium]|nr:low molecular weight phosphotyrosine protein phosphatase [Bacilli bacterium]
MNRICFICLGNICRSPMAEYILKDMLIKNNIDNVIVETRATSYEEQGNDMYPKAKKVLNQKGIPYNRREAKRLENKDYDKYDIFYYMEDKNLKNIERILESTDKCQKLLDKDIEDPWYTNNFEKVFEEIEEGCKEIIKKLKNN